MMKNYKKIECITSTINNFKVKKVINYDCLYLTSNDSRNRVIFEGYGFFHNKTNAFKKVIFNDLDSSTYSEEIVDGKLIITGYDYQKIIHAILTFLNKFEDLAA